MLVWLIRLLFTALNWIIIIDCILSWMPNINQNRFTVVINSISNVILMPIRNILAKFDFRIPIDISPIIAIILLGIIKNFIIGTIVLIVSGRWII